MAALLHRLPPIVLQLSSVAVYLVCKRKVTDVMRHQESASTGSLHSAAGVHQGGSLQQQHLLQGLTVDAGFPGFIGLDNMQRLRG